MKGSWLVAAVAAMATATSATPANAATARTANRAPVDPVAPKARVLVLTDMGNEPDDQMSFVRLLVYSNELDIEGLVATTSTWLRTKTNERSLHEIIDAYGKVRPNLLRHAQGWPKAEHLHGLVAAGQPGFGMAAVGPDKLTAGAAAIIRAADRPDSRPLWISVWGGANTLAQALMHVRATRSPQAVDALVAKLRVNAISDQDDAGPWLRREFPKLFYVVKPSAPDSEEYHTATWTGISGDVFFRNGDGADGSTVTNEWLDIHIRAKGPLGKYYPKFLFIMEGDTPAFLGLTANGLNSFESPSWGGWGGRYVFRQPYGETHPIWTQGGSPFGRVNSQDGVPGTDGKLRVSDFATIWRWRTDFQNDFAARMDWTVQPYARANHNPVAVVNGIGGTAPIRLDAEVGKPLVLDAAGTRDPDGDQLHYRWISYPEAGFEPGTNMGEIELGEPQGARITVTPSKTCRADWLDSQGSCDVGVAHIILAVTDSGSPALTSYRRIILNIRAAGRDN